MDSSVLLGVIIALVALAVAVYATVRGGTPGSLEEVVRRLASDLAEARRRIGELEAENRQLRADLNALRQLVNRTTSPAPEAPPAQQLPSHPLLLVMGDEAAGQIDEAAIMRARISYRRRQNCTAQDLDEELRRRRLDGTLYPWIHIAAHMGPEGIQLGNDVVSRDWLLRRLQGVQILFLNGCENVKVADGLAGLVDWVVVIYEKIDQRDAGDFAYSFWNAIATSQSPAQAYLRALKEVPQVSAFVDMRKA